SLSIQLEPTFHTLGFNISLTPSYPQIQTAQINPGELPTVISYLGLGTNTAITLVVTTGFRLLEGSLVLDW
ncbi:hypothetical protein AGABI1DRAFT_116429, partial [Agaricus bisporus var. burnettii JB137-S8]